VIRCLHVGSLKTTLTCLLAHPLQPVKQLGKKKVWRMGGTTRWRGQDHACLLCLHTVPYLAVWRKATPEDPPPWLALACLAGPAGCCFFSRQRTACLVLRGCQLPPECGVVGVSIDELWNGRAKIAAQPLFRLFEVLLDSSTRKDNSSCQPCGCVCTQYRLV
jgi:hypothetical protein